MEFFKEFVKFFFPSPPSDLKTVAKSKTASSHLDPFISRVFCGEFPDPLMDQTHELSKQQKQTCGELTDPNGSDT